MLRLLIAYKQAFYGWIRQRTRPMSIEEAEEKRTLWSKIYAITSLAALGLIAHNFYINPSREKDSKKLASSLALFPSESIRFITFKGFKKIEDFNLTKEELQQLQKSQPESSPELVPSQNQNPKPPAPKAS